MVGVIFIFTSVLFLVDAEPHWEMRAGEDWGMGQFLDVVLFTATHSMAKDLCGAEDNVELYDISKKSIECMKTTYGFYSICLIENQTTCFGKVAEYLDNCVNPSLHGFPKFFLDVLFSILTFFCDSEMKDLLELTNPCLDVNRMNITSCVYSTFDNTDSSENFRDLVCRVFQDEQDCVLDTIKGDCEDSSTRNYIDKLYEASVQKPCSKIS